MCVCETSVRQVENVACRCVKSWSRSCLGLGRQTTRQQTLRCLNTEAHTGHCLSLSLSHTVSILTRTYRQHHPAVDAVNTTADQLTYAAINRRNHRRKCKISPDQREN